MNARSRHTRWGICDPAGQGLWRPESLPVCGFVSLSVGRDCQSRADRGAFHTQTVTSLAATDATARSEDAWFKCSYGHGSRLGPVTAGASGTRGVLEPGGELAPDGRTERQDGARAVLGVADQHASAASRGVHLYAVSAAVSAVAAFAPVVAACGFHRSPANFKIRSRDAVRGRASARTWSKTTAVFRMSVLLSTV